MGPGIDRLLRNKKPALCVLSKNATAKTHFKGDIFGLIFMHLCCIPTVLMYQVSAFFIVLRGLSPLI